MSYSSLTADILGARKIAEHFIGQCISFCLILLSFWYFTDVFSGSVSSESKIVLSLSVGLLCILHRCLIPALSPMPHVRFWPSVGLRLLGSSFHMLLGEFQFPLFCSYLLSIFPHSCLVPSAASLHVHFVLIVLNCFYSLLFSWNLEGRGECVLNLHV